MSKILQFAFPDSTNVVRGRCDELMRTRRVSANRAFTLIEVMMAATIMILVFVSSIGVIGASFRLLEDARMGTLASQVLQSEMENLRLNNWAQIAGLPASGSFAIDTTLNVAAMNRFTCTREIEDAGTNMKKVTVAITWTAMNGQPRVRRYVTYIAKGGLNDYYYRKF